MIDFTKPIRTVATDLQESISCRLDNMKDEHALVMVLKEHIIKKNGDKFCQKEHSWWFSAQGQLAGFGENALSIQNIPEDNMI